MANAYTNLKALRAKHGVSQKRMAEVLGISKVSFNRKENGKREFTLDECKQIATYFNADPQAIFFAD